MPSVTLTIPAGCETCCCESVSLTTLAIYVSGGLSADTYAKVYVNGVLKHTSTLIFAGDDPFVLPIDPADLNPLAPGDVITIAGDAGIEFGGSGWGSPPEAVAMTLGFDCLCNGVTVSRGTSLPGPVTTGDISISCADWV